MSRHGIRRSPLRNYRGASLSPDRRSESLRPPSPQIVEADRGDKHRSPTRKNNSPRRSPLRRRSPVRRRGDSPYRKPHTDHSPMRRRSPSKRPSPSTRARHHSWSSDELRRPTQRGRLHRSSSRRNSPRDFSPLPDSSRIRQSSPRSREISPNRRSPVRRRRSPRRRSYSGESGNRSKPDPYRTSESRSRLYDRRSGRRRDEYVRRDLSRRREGPWSRRTEQSNTPLRKREHEKRRADSSDGSVEGRNRKERRKDDGRECHVPFLVRVFVKHGEEQDEYHVYAWQNSQIHEIVNQLKHVMPVIRESVCLLAFSKFSYQPNIVIPPKEEGEPMCVVSSKFHRWEESQTLDSFRYKVGDILAVSLKPQMSLRRQTQTAKEEISKEDFLVEEAEDIREHAEEDFVNVVQEDKKEAEGGI